MTTDVGYAYYMDSQAFEIRLDDATSSLSASGTSNLAMDAEESTSGYHQRQSDDTPQIDESTTDVPAICHFLRRT